MRLQRHLAFPTENTKKGGLMRVVALLRSDVIQTNAEAQLQGISFIIIISRLYEEKTFLLSLNAIELESTMNFYYLKFALFDQIFCLF